MADQTKRVTIELDASALPNLKRTFGEVERGAAGMAGAVGKAKGSMISDLRAADRGVQALSHSVFMLGSVAGGMDQKFGQAFAAFGAVHAALQGVRGLAMEIKVLSGAMGTNAGATLAATAANRALASSEKEVAVAALAKKAAMGMTAMMGSSSAIASSMLHPGQHMTEFMSRASQAMPAAAQTPWWKPAPAAAGSTLPIGVGTMAGAFGGVGAAMPIAAISVVAAASLAVLVSPTIQNWLATKLVEIEKPGSKAAEAGGTWKWENIYNPKSYAKWLKYKYQNMFEDPHLSELRYETPWDRMLRRKRENVASEGVAAEIISTRAPYVERERQLRESWWDTQTRARFGPFVPGAGRALAGPHERALQGIFGIQAGFPRLMEHGGDIALQTRMESARETAREMGEKQAAANFDVGVSGAATLRAFARKESIKQELRNWEKSRREPAEGAMGPFPPGKTHAQGEDIQTRLKQAEEEYKALIDQTNASLKNRNQIGLDNLKTVRDTAQQEMLRYRAERAQAEAKLLSFKERWGGMDPSSRKAAINVMEEARRNIAALEAGAKLPQGQQRQWRMIAGKRQLDPAMLGMMSQDKMAHLERTDPELAARYKRAIAGADPEFKRAAGLTEAERQRGEALAAEKAAGGKLGEAQAAIKGKLDDNAQAIADNLIQFVIRSIDQQMLQVKVALDQKLNQQENLRHGADRQLAPGN